MSDTPAQKLREDDIRADRLKAAQIEALEHDKRWLDERRAEFVDVACPACGGRERAPGGRFEKHPFTYERCVACETFYVSPRPPAAMLAAYYGQTRNGAYWNEHIFPASENARRERIFRPRVHRTLELLARHGAGNAALVEVGPGFGTFGEEMRALGHFQRIVVVEPTPDLAATCRRRGLEVLEKPIEAVADGELQAPVVVSFECIEHLFDPAAFVRQCARILEPGGLLILTCPSGGGFDVLTLREVSDTVDHEHLNYFNPDSLALLLRTAGLDVVEWSTPGLLDVELVRKKVQAGLFSLADQPFLEKVVMDERLGDALQGFLAENRLSSHLWMVGQKPKKH